MIDLCDETVLTLADATDHLPRRRRGAKPHVCTLIRWAKVGVRGAKLETLRVGGTLCTSLEALQRFCERCSGDDTSTVVRTSTRRRRDQERADKELTAAGI